MYCNKCGSEIVDGSEFCSSCGTKIKQSSKKEKKEMSKGMRIFVVILLSILFIYFTAGIIFILKDVFSELSKGATSILPAFVFALALVILCGYGLIENISKLNSKKELTEEQVQKRKKRNIIFGVSSIIAVVLTIIIMFGYGYFSENAKREQMINKIKEYQNNGYIEWSDKDYQELETYSNSEIEKVLNKVETTIKLIDEYDKKYSAKLDEIFAKEIKVELYQSEDNNYMYIPFNTSTGERYSKAQVEYVTISKYANDIIEIYYSVEMELTVINKYNGIPVSRGRVKKYYKVENINELDKTIKINGYKGLEEELTNDIQGKTNKVVAKPSESKNYNYDFINIEK